MQFQDYEAEIVTQIADVEVLPAWESRLALAAAKIIRFRDRYEDIESQTGVPWALIGALHYRESSQNFRTHLHNGDSLTARTRHQPKGRPATGSPPFTWEESAIDALTGEGMTQVHDWSDARICFEAEKYNGFGYRRKNIRKPSPYVWGGTSLCQVGKFDTDGHYDPALREVQCGFWPLYQAVLAHTEARAEQTNVEDTLADSVKYTVAKRVKRGVEAGWATLGSLFTYDNAMLGLKVLLSLGLAGALVWLLMHWFQSQMRADVRGGRTVPSRQTAGKAPLEEGDNV